MKPVKNSKMTGINNIARQNRGMILTITSKYFPDHFEQLFL